MQTTYFAPLNGNAPVRGFAAPCTGRVGALLRSGLRIALLLGIVLAVQALASRLVLQFPLEPSAGQAVMLDVMAALLAVGYVIMMALPFVPAIELGVAIMLVCGPGAIGVVYLCTQVAMLLSYGLGRALPLGRLAAVAARLRLHRARSTLGWLEGLAPERRLEFLLQHLPQPWARRLLRHRCLALAVLINLPGNALVGGAGGIGLVAGMSGLFTPVRYLLAVAMATAPVPLVFWLAGTP